MFYVRTLLENEHFDYYDAVENIKVTPVSVPTYVAIGGLHDGCIFEKNDVGYRELHSIDD